MTTMLYEKEWNEYIERKSHSDYTNSLLPDDSLLKTRNLTDSESDTYNKQIESESTDTGVMMSTMKQIIISTMKELPETCCDCPCHNVENGCCQAISEYRSSIWRPFWCPLREVETNE